MRIFNYKIKKVENMSLNSQLVLVTLVALVICLVIMGIILPNILNPFYEASIYNHLSQPSNFIEPGSTDMGEDIAFIVITKYGAVYTSKNLNKIVPNLMYDEIIELASDRKGKFENNSNTYYYMWGQNEGSRNLILMDDSSIKIQSKSLLGIIIPTMVATISITILLLYAWSKYVLSKIKKLEKRTKAIITGEQVEGREFIIDDELNELNNTIEQVDKELKQKEEYKNMMFQNLSHELKTPISVIQSYVEAVNDGVVDKDEAINIIDEEAKNLLNQVQTILQINKLDYMKDSKEYLKSNTNVYDVILESVEKHKLIRTDVEFVVNLDKNSKESEYTFTGTKDIWQGVIDNILGNFMRYAKSKIYISIKNNEITLENDGEKLDENMLDKIFLPYVKGKKGQSGLGLSIVKKAVNVFGYDISAYNLENGVRFVIK